MDNLRFRECADMHLIVGETHGNGAVPVKLYGYNKYPHHGLPNLRNFRVTDRRIMKISTTNTVRPATVDSKYWQHEQLTWKSVY
jgi:hypothetical protein